MKFGRLVAGGLKTAPFRCDMPTAEELVSFRLELCVPPRPANVLQAENPMLKAGEYVVSLVQHVTLELAAAVFLLVSRRIQNKLIGC